MAPLDKYYLAITLLVTIGYQLLGFAIAWTCQFDKITDFTGGSNFFFLALLTLIAGNTYHARNLVASILVMVWAIRLAGFLLVRVMVMGSDSRFDTTRSHFFKFLAFWVAQIIWVWAVSLPLTILNSHGVSDTRTGGSNPHLGTSRDVAGIVIWTLGFIIETIADLQKFRYKASNAPKAVPFAKGLWSWSRHPPYFGEILVWWGIWMLCLSPTTNGDLPSSARAAQYGSVVSPILTTFLLLFASGIPTAEKPTAKKFYLISYGPNARPGDADAWPRYQAYLRRTSILIPIPPAIYGLLPEIVKKSVLLDFPFYQFDEKVDGPAVVREVMDGSTPQAG